MSVVATRIEDGVAVVTMDNPPVNALGQSLRAGLLEALRAAAVDDAVRAVVLIGAGRGFSAGADIREFGKPPAEPRLAEVLEALESSPKPVVAAIHGTALGGGLETALCCHYRVAAPDAKVGLPEVNIGLVPGAGGTQRLPRLAGVERALDVITSGRMVGAAEAAEAGIVDAVVEGDLEAGAVAFARQRLAGGGPHPAVRERPVAAPADPEFFVRYRERLAHRARGQRSPLAAVDAVEAAASLPFDEGLAREREIFTELMESDQRAALIHAFFAEREAAKIPGLSPDAAPRPVERAAVIGAGTMGGGIAMCFANAGIPVTVVEATDEALAAGLERVRGSYASSVERGRLSEEAMRERLGRIAGSTDYGDVAGADLVIEAVFEDMDLKREVFARLDAVAKPGAVLATNTSTLDVDRIAAATSRPEDVVGMHFFSPANVMRLIEVVRGARTADDVIRTAMGVARPLGKVAVLVGVCDGFVGNRMLHRYQRQAMYMIEDGALPWDVDRVFTGFGMPMGPFAMGDLAGLDVGYRIRKARAAARPSNERYSDIADRIVEMGRLGQKTGAGWYRYEPGSRKPIPDPEIEALILEVAKEKGIERRPFSDEEILKRLVYAMINEGAKILEEGIALRPSDIDVVYLNGYGFPRWRGGPMYHADRVGLAAILDDVRAFQARDGQGWEPAPLLERLVAEGRTFASLQEG